MWNNIFRQQTQRLAAFLALMACTVSYPAAAMDAALWHCLGLKNLAQSSAEGRNKSSMSPARTRPEDIASFLTMVFGKEHKDELMKQIKLREGFLLDPRLTPFLDERIEYLRENPSLIPSKILRSDDPLLWDAVILLSVFPSLKEIVWRKGAGTRQQLTNLGVNPALFWNKHDPQLVQMHIDGLLKDEASRRWLQNNINPELKNRTGHVLSDFNQDPELRSIYADELAEELIVAINKKLSKAKVSDAGTDAFKAVLTALKDDDSDAQMIVSKRDFDAFKGGDLAGDCTACGGVNYWTNGAWNLSLENIEIRTYYRGKFFARFLMVAGTNEGKPVLFVHAVEFTPLVRATKSETSKGSILAQSEHQQGALRQSLEMVFEHAQRAGFSDVLLTNISNSRGIDDYLKKFVASSANDATFKNEIFELLNPLDSAHELQGELRGAHTPINFLLQAWTSSNAFAYKGAERQDNEFIVMENGLKINTGLVNQMANSFVHELENILGGVIEEEGGRTHSTWSWLKLEKYLANDYKARFVVDYSHTKWGQSNNHKSLAGEPFDGLHQAIKMLDGDIYDFIDERIGGKGYSPVGVLSRYLRLQNMLAFLTLEENSYTTTTVEIDDPVDKGKKGAIEYLRKRGVTLEGLQKIRRQLDSFVILFEEIVAGSYLVREVEQYYVKFHAQELIKLYSGEGDPAHVEWLARHPDFLFRHYKANGRPNSINSTVKVLSLRQVFAP